MTTRVLLLRLSIGPDLARGEGPRIGRTGNVWTVQTHQGQTLATLYTPGIPDDEVHLRETPLAIEIVRIRE